MRLIFLIVPFIQQKVSYKDKLIKAITTEKFTNILAPDNIFSQKQTISPTYSLNYSNDASLNKFLLKFQL